MSAKRKVVARTTTKTKTNNFNNNNLQLNSQGWFSNLLRIALLKTKARRDHARADYLARILTCGSGSENRIKSSHSATGGGYGY